MLRNALEFTSCLKFQVPASFLCNTIPNVECLERTLIYCFITRLSTDMYWPFVKCWKIKQNQVQSLTKEAWWRRWILNQTPFFVEHLMKSHEPYEIANIELFLTYKNCDLILFSTIISGDLAAHRWIYLDLVSCAKSGKFIQASFQFVSIILTRNE